jgi:hypothetical protein
MTCKTAAGEAVPPPPSIDDLEEPIMDAVRMASIAVNLAERAVGGKPMKRGEDGVGLYHLTNEQRENLMFAIIKTESAIDAIRAKWETLS